MISDGVILLAVVTLVLVIVTGFFATTWHTDELIARMVINGASPLEAKCALREDNRGPTCIASIIKETK